MSLSIVFSSGIYLVATNELQSRVSEFRTNIENILEGKHSPNVDVILHASDDLQASDRLIAGLFYTNLVMLAGGGAISYILARRSLIPIKKLHDAQSRFTSDASHELKTPLAVMKAEMEVTLRDKNATNKELRETLSSSLEEVDKLTKLADMLLSLSRLDDTKLKFSPVNLDKTTKSVIGSYKLHKNRFIFTSKRQQVIRGNETAIVDLIKVLADNAIKYSPEKSKINITISNHNREYAKLEISNEGPGIRADKLPYIFDRFYRINTTKDYGSPKGYGLGLALAKNITELHDGEISAVSKPGKLTTFSVLLPLNTRYSKKVKK